MFSVSTLIVTRHLFLCLHPIVVGRFCALETELRSSMPACRPISPLDSHFWFKPSYRITSLRGIKFASSAIVIIQTAQFIFWPDFQQLLHGISPSPSPRRLLLSSVLPLVSSFPPPLLPYAPSMSRVLRVNAGDPRIQNAGG